MPHSSAPPLPIAATWAVVGFVYHVQVTFDQPLTPGPLAAGNWKARIGGYVSTATTAAATGNVVDFAAPLVGASDPGPNMVFYAATPPDLTGLPPASLPVAPFQHPLTP